MSRLLSALTLLLALSAPSFAETFRNTYRIPTAVDELLNAKQSTVDSALIACA